MYVSACKIWVLRLYFLDFCGNLLRRVADSFVCVGCGLMILWLFLDEAAQRKAKKAAEEAPEVSEHEE